MTLNSCAKALGLDARTVKKRVEGSDIVNPVGEIKGYKAYFLGDVARAAFAQEKQEEGVAAYDVDRLMPKELAEHWMAKKRELEYLHKQRELVYYNEASEKFAELAQTFGKFFPTFIDDLEQTGLYTVEQLSEMESLCDQARIAFSESEF